MNKYLKRKFSLNFPLIMTLWVLLLIVSILTSIAIFVDIISTEHPSVFKSPLFGITYKFTLYSHIFVELLLFILWRKSTFRRQEMVRILKDEGFAMRKRSPLFNFLTTWFRSFPEGRKKDIYVKADIMGSFNLATLFGDKENVNSELVFTKDRVAFASLISGPFNILEEIKIDKTTRIIPETNVPEMDTILEESLKDVSDFRAYIVFNSECLMLAVVGSSWLGRKFGERILMSAEIIEKLNNALKVKYPATKSWDEYELKYNYYSGPTEFEIARKEVEL